MPKEFAEAGHEGVEQVIAQHGGGKTDSTVTQAVNESGDDPFSLANIRMSQANLPVIKEAQGKIGVGRPSTSKFFTVHADPEFTITTNLLCVKDDGSYYLPIRTLWDELSDEPLLQVRQLVPTVTPGGELMLWPLRLPDQDGRLDSWSESALEIAEYAKTRWVRLRPNHSAFRYDCFEAQGDLPAPKWPDLSFEEMMKLAFRDRRITSLDHPVLRRLRGEIA